MLHFHPYHQKLFKMGVSGADTTVIFYEEYQFSLSALTFWLVGIYEFTAVLKSHHFCQVLRVIMKRFNNKRYLETAAVLCFLSGARLNRCYHSFLRSYTMWLSGTIIVFVFVYGKCKDFITVGLCIKKKSKFPVTI